ncbi:MAG: hypothetical protein QXT40_03600 [Candidatus Micrarchaeia archaeon]
MSEDVLTKIIEKIEDHERRIARLEKLFEKKPETIKKISINELLIDKKPTNELQKVLVFAYYLEKYEGYQEYNVKDIENWYRNAKEKIPSNLSDKLQKNVKKGYLMELKEKKEGLKTYSLTNKGLKFVENNFSDK